MKIEEAIKKLQDIQESHGNIDLRHFSGEESCLPDPDIDFDVYHEKPGRVGKALWAYAYKATH